MLLRRAFSRILVIGVSATCKGSLGCGSISPQDEAIILILMILAEIGRNWLMITSFIFRKVVGKKAKRACRLGLSLKPVRTTQH